MLTCGGDFHADTYRPRCGTYFPDEIADSYSLGRYLRSTDRIKLCIHEPYAENCFDYDYSVTFTS